MQRTLKSAAIGVMVLTIAVTAAEARRHHQKQGNQQTQTQFSPGDYGNTYQSSPQKAAIKRKYRRHAAKRGLDKKEIKATAALKSVVVQLRTQIGHMAREVGALKVALVSAPTIADMAKVPIIRRSTGFDDVDIHERLEMFVPTPMPAPVQVPSSPLIASLPPRAEPERVAGRVIFASWVDHSCFPKALSTILADTAAHFGRDVIVNSGYRSPAHNRRVRGARGSQHIHCRAADFRVEGVVYAKLASWLWRHPGVKGLGLYTGLFVHVDVRAVKVTWSQFPIATARALIGANDNVHVARYGHRKRVAGRKQHRA